MSTRNSSLSPDTCLYNMRVQAMRSLFLHIMHAFRVKDIDAAKNERKSNKSSLCLAVTSLRPNLWGSPFKCSRIIFGVYRRSRNARSTARGLGWIRRPGRTHKISTAAEADIGVQVCCDLKHRGRQTAPL